MTEDNKRFVFEISLYGYGKTEKEALKEVSKILNKINRDHDGSNAEIEKMSRLDFGKTKAENIDFKKLQNGSN